MDGGGNRIGSRGWTLSRGNGLYRHRPTVSLAPGENEGEFLLKIHVGKDYDAQRLLALIAELKEISDGPTTAGHP